MRPKRVGHGLCTARASLKILITASFLVYPLASQAEEFWENTFLLDLRMGSSRSDIASGFARGGYELDDGSPIDFADWYTARFPDFNVKFLTSVSDDFGLIWGFSTGERGEKYRIDPGLWIGFIYRYEITTRSEWTLSAMTLFGGNFQERTCQAYYAIIDSVETVNCRLAATPLPPKDTLRFLVRERGFRETRATLRYQIRF
jgi:hypothetical protein